VNSSLRHLYWVLAAGFGALILMLGYWQVVAAPSLDDRADNPQAIQRERQIDRGRILSADGKVLADRPAGRERGQRVYERVYPQGELAAQAIGYSTSQQGKSGLEASWNRYLAGSYGTEPLLQRLNLREKRGANVRTYLDTRVQEAAQAGLLGKRGAAVALDPRTGGVIAMASSPTYDLNTAVTDFAAVESQSGGPLVNRASDGRYPPGSTFKVVTATAALESGIYTPTSEFDDNGRYVVDGRAITNFGNRRFGSHTLTDALTNSINTTFARIGESLGASRLGATMTAYGFGERPPIDLPAGEVFPSGRYDGDELLPNDEAGEDVARIAIGQERLLVTPLQMAMVAAGVANDGTVMAPHLGREAVDRGGSVVRELRPTQVGQSSSPAVANELTEMMTRVVEEGTGTAAALSSTGVQVAGKTGTAETGDANRNQAWFIGFAPADDPVIAVAVVVEDTPGQGGVEAAPIAARIMETAIDVGAGGP
jgi:peptidoglycan glycosyltransferase